MLNFLKNSQGKILNLFINNPEKEYYLREIAKILNQDIGTIQYALDVLTKNSLLIDSRRGNLRFFKLNREHPLYPEIKNIISKTIGVEKKIKDIMKKIDNIECAFIFGSYAKNKDISSSDIDLFIIGDNVNQDLLVDLIDSTQKEIDREINYHLYSEKEFIEKIKKNNSFISNILNQSKIIIKGDLNKLTTKTG